MRGKAVAIASGNIVCRITPAYAGKSIEIDDYMFFHRDHPRLCGEKHYLSVFRLFLLGSPPPMRGKVLCCGHAVHAGGITPAYAGKSINKTHCKVCIEDHPRLCGEKLKSVTPLIRL